MADLAEEKRPLEAALPLHFRRARTTRTLAVLALIAAGLALVGPIPAIGIDESLQAPALGGAVGCLFAILLLSLLTGLPEYLRMVLAAFGFTISASAIDLAVPQGAIPPAAAAAGVAAALAVLYEWRTGVELSERGIAWNRGLPWLKPTSIAWGDVESVTASLRTILTRFVGESLPDIESQCGFVVRGAGQRIVFGTPRYRWREEQVPSDPRWTSVLLTRAAPAAVAWTVNRLRTAGRVRLGRVEVTRTGIAIRRWSGWIVIERHRLRGLTIEGGFLHFDMDGERIRVPINKVPNALFLPQILKAASG